MLVCGMWWSILMQSISFLSSTFVILQTEIYDIPPWTTTKSNTLTESKSDRELIETLFDTLNTIWALKLQVNRNNMLTWHSIKNNQGLLTSLSNRRRMHDIFHSIIDYFWILLVLWREIQFDLIFLWLLWRGKVLGATVQWQYISRWKFIYSNNIIFIRISIQINCLYCMCVCVRV